MTIMNSTALDILHYLYHTTKKGGPVLLYDLEVRFALSGSELQGILEDLKEEELVVESDAGFHVSQRGVAFGKTRWI